MINQIRIPLIIWVIKFFLAIVSCNFMRNTLLIILEWMILCRYYCSRWCCWLIQGFCAQRFENLAKQQVYLTFYLLPSHFAQVLDKVDLICALKNTMWSVWFHLAEVSSLYLASNGPASTNCIHIVPLAGRVLVVVGPEFLVTVLKLIIKKS